MTYTSDEKSAVDFCTLGMFIVDDIEFLPPRSPVKDVLGGAGSYSALGARIMSPGPSSRSVSWTVDCGSDFPHNVLDTINSWDTTCMLRQTPERLTTRGWNGYGANEHRSFKYLTPKLRLDQDSLSDIQLASNSFHLICSPLRCISMVKGIISRRSNKYPQLKRPIFIWEPVPGACTFDELGNCEKALEHIDYMSPNHQELAGFYGESGQIGDEVDKVLIARLAQQLMLSGQKGVVVRCGKEGCYYIGASDDREPWTDGWLPAYHSDAQKVVDPTGGGNTFLGGMGVALARGQDLKTAAIWGTVAASFAIEQVGMPKLTLSDRSSIWNGETMETRLEAYTHRLDQMRYDEIQHEDILRLVE